MSEMALLVPGFRPNRGNVPLERAALSPSVANRIQDDVLYKYFVKVLGFVRVKGDEMGVWSCLVGCQGEVMLLRKGI